MYTEYFTVINILKKNLVREHIIIIKATWWNKYYHLPIVVVIEVRLPTS